MPKTLLSKIWVENNWLNDSTQPCWKSTDIERAIKGNLKHKVGSNLIEVQSESRPWREKIECFRRKSRTKNQPRRQQKLFSF